MITIKSNLGRILLSTMLAVSATLVSVQSAEASSVGFYDRGEHEEHGSEHGGCSGGGHNCITTNYSSSYYAFKNDVSTLMDAHVAGLKTLNVSIAYPDVSKMLLDSAYLWIKASDDATGRNADSTSHNGDGEEYLDILKVENKKVSVKAQEIDESGWYFKFDVMNFVTGSHTSPLDFLLATVNLEHGQSDLLFQNARLDLNYHTIYCPTPNSPSAVPLPATLPLMLSGLGVLGFTARRRKQKLQETEV